MPLWIVLLVQIVPCLIQFGLKHVDVLDMGNKFR